MKDIKGAVFIGQSKDRFIRGRIHYKIRNNYADSCEDPEFKLWLERNDPQELSELEEMYKEFCKKAYNYILSKYCPEIPHRIIFPDFRYDIILNKFTIE